MKIEPDCPATTFEGLASVRLPARVTLKLLPSAKSGVMVAPSVKPTTAPRWAAVNDWVTLRPATVVVASGKLIVRFVLLSGVVSVNVPVPDTLGNRDNLDNLRSLRVVVVLFC